MSVSDSPKNIYVVLGTARSGTSAIARGLKSLGVDLGNTFIDASKRVNPTGFWEDKEIAFTINREVYSNLEFMPNGIASINKELLTGDTLKNIRKKAVDLVRKRFESRTSWGFKDPKTARLVPFWLSVFATLDINEHYVIVLRNPLASAHSHQRLSGAAIETGLLRWLMDLIPIIQETAQKSRVIVSYESLMENPGKQLDRIRDHLDMASGANTDEIDCYISDFLDRDLNRYQFSLEDLKNHPATQAVPLCLGVFELLRRISNDELDFSDPEFIAEWEKIMKQLEMGNPLISYIDSLLKGSHEFRKEIKSIRRSIFWKATYPLRRIHDGFRKFRKDVRKSISG